MDKHIFHRRLWLRSPLVLLALALILLSALVSSARAGDFPHERKGLLLGFNLGGGGANLEFERFGVKVEREVGNLAGGIGRIGYGFSDHFALTLEGHVFGKTNNEVDVQAVLALVTVNWYPGGGGFFLRAGAGGGAANTKFLDLPTTLTWTERETEGAGSFGLGYEWRLGRQFALGMALDGRVMGFADLPGFSSTILSSGLASLQLNWYL